MSRTVADQDNKCQNVHAKALWNCDSFLRLAYSLSLPRDIDPCGECEIFHYEFFFWLQLLYFFFFVLLLIAVVLGFFANGLDQQASAPVTALII